MRVLDQHKGLVVPMDRANVDTDLIIPKQFLKSIKRTGFGPNLFDSLRYLDEGQPGMDNSSRPLNDTFVLNNPKFKDGSILLTRKNFGCGSSREHAPWALIDYGFRVIIGSSFADIFYNNCFKNGLLPIVLSEEKIQELFDSVAVEKKFWLEVDLKSQRIIKSDGGSIHFDIDAFRKDCLLKGLDDIGLTLERAEKIKDYERKRAEITPWLFPE